MFEAPQHPPSRISPVDRIIMGEEEAQSSKTKNPGESISEQELADILQACRAAGKSENYAVVVQLASLGLSKVHDSMYDHLATLKPIRRLFLSCSFHGYKGFALWKQDSVACALPFLRESQRLREKILEGSICEADFPEEKERVLTREGAVVDHALNEIVARSSTDRIVESKPIKYPRTVHLFDCGGTSTTADDLVLGDLTSVLAAFSKGSSGVTIEEKIDGANLGISQCPVTGEILVQNRSHYISKGDHAQFNRIPDWVAEHREALVSILEGGNRILYGEWVVARHSIPYKKLPGWFVAFDLYDKETGKFFSRRRFHCILRGSKVPVAPVLHRCFHVPEGRAPHHDPCPSQVGLLRQELLNLLESKSSFRDDEGTVEGIILRLDDHPWSEQKYKIVRPDFVRGCNGTHWSSRPIEKQVVDVEFSQSYLESCYCFAE